jgi:hypothetical protein
MYIGIAPKDSPLPHYIGVRGTSPVENLNRHHQHLLAGANNDPEYAEGVWTVHLGEWNTNVRILQRREQEDGFKAIEVKVRCNNLVRTLQRRRIGALLKVPYPDAQEKDPKQAERMHFAWNSGVDYLESAGVSCAWIACCMLILVGQVLVCTSLAGVVLACL